MQVYIRKQDGTFWSIVGVGAAGRIRVKQCLADGKEQANYVSAACSKEEFDAAFERYTEDKIVEVAREFQVGDVVILKSGGLQMTVANLTSPEYSDCATCCWMNAEGELRSMPVRRAILTRVDDLQLQPVPMGAL